MKCSTIGEGTVIFGVRVVTDSRNAKCSAKIGPVHLTGLWITSFSIGIVSPRSFLPAFPGGTSDEYHLFLRRFEPKVILR